mgnify:CR=1 FL=1
MFLYSLCFVGCNSAEIEKSVSAQNSLERFTQEMRTENDLIWKLNSEIDDSILKFKILSDLSFVPKNSWYLEVIDSVPSDLVFNSNNTCGVGTPICDSLSWKNYNDTVELLIRTSLIGSGEYKTVQGRYSLEQPNDTLLILKKQ